MALRIADLEKQNMIELRRLLKLGAEYAAAQEKWVLAATLYRGLAEIDLQRMIDDTNGEPAWNAHTAGIHPTVQPRTAQQPVPSCTTCGKPIVTHRDPVPGADGMIGGPMYAEHVDSSIDDHTPTLKEIDAFLADWQALSPGKVTPGIRSTVPPRTAQEPVLYSTCGVCGTRVETDQIDVTDHSGLPREFIAGMSRHINPALDEQHAPTLAE